MASEQNISLALKKLYEESENRIKTDALINRAYTEKISSETIKEKVEAQNNAIRIGIHEINPKFKEGSKHYETIQDSINSVMVQYEQALKELSEFYDGKIEQLILRKVELEASLIGALTNEHYLCECIKKIEEQKKIKVKSKVSSTIKKVFRKLTNIKKEKKTVDFTMKIEEAKEKQKENKIVLEKIEKEIRLTNDEIRRINERKKQSLYEAMEVGDRNLTVTIRKPKMFKKITRFFVSRFNTSKVILNTIIEPLNQRVESFKNNELSSMKG